MFARWSAASSYASNARFTVHHTGGTTTLTMDQRINGGRWNLFAMPAGVVPVTTVRPEEAKGREVRDRVDKRAAAVEERSAGLPVCAQVVGKPWADHVILAVMAAIEAGVRNGEEFPRTPIDPRGSI